MSTCYSTEYTWDVTNFSKLCSDVGYRIDSDFMENGNVKSRLGLCPNGNIEQNKGYLSLYLWVGCPVPYDSTVMFEIRGNDGRYKHMKKRIDVVPADCREGWGFDQFIRRDYVLDPKNNLLNNDTLTIKCVMIASPTSLALKSKIPSMISTNGNSDCVVVNRDNNGIIVYAREFHLHV